MRLVTVSPAFFLPLIALAQAPNTLTPAERDAGWQLLFDGYSLKSWDEPARRTPPGDSWTIADGCIKAIAHPAIREDLISRALFRDFELVFDWRIAPGSNSGVKYLVQRTVVLDYARLPKDLGSFEAMVGYALAHPTDRSAISPQSRADEYVISFEYQLVDNDRHPDARRGPLYQTGALYGLIAPTKPVPRPVGEFNHSRLVVRGNHVEHWLNGVLVVEGDLDSKPVIEGIAKRWHAAPAVAELLTKRPRQACPITLQNHGDAAWFRNLKIRPL